MHIGSITHSISIQTSPAKHIDAELISIINAGISSQAAVQVKQQKNITMLDSIYKHITPLTGKTANTALTIEPIIRIHIAHTIHMKTIERTLKIVPNTINVNRENRTDTKHIVIQHTQHPIGGHMHNIAFINTIRQAVAKKIEHVPAKKSKAHPTTRIIKTIVLQAVSIKHIINTKRKKAPAARQATNRPITITILNPIRIPMLKTMHTNTVLLNSPEQHKSKSIPAKIRALTPINPTNMPITI